jgi:hypothetical protein
LITGVNNITDKFVSGVVDTAEQLIAGVGVDTADKHSFVIIWAFFEKSRNDPKAILRGPGDTDS